MMTNPYSNPLATLLCTFGMSAALVNPLAAGSNDVSALNIPLHDLVEMTAVRHQQVDRDAHDAPPFRTSTWLAALPSVTLGYLQSDEDAGTEETEVSLNLPIKSPYRAAQDKKLREMRASLADTEAQRRRLYFSGLLREALWSEKIARIRVAHTEDKIEQIEALFNRQQALFDARSASRYSMLLLRQELADAQLVLAEQQLAADSWRERFRQLSGIGNLPATIEEPAPTQDNAWQGHPALRMLDLSWQRQRLVIAANSARASNWDLALRAIQLESPAFEETQYGFSVEIPLSAFGTAEESSDSDWRENSRDYWQQRDELQLQLTQAWRQLQSEASYLTKRQILLDESTRASEELVAETRLLIGENEMAREIWVRRVLGDIDKKAESAINQLLIGQNRAMSRQAAGIPL